MAVASPKLFFTIRETAQIIGVSPSSVRVYLREGRLHPRRVERPLALSASDVFAFKSTFTKSPRGRPSADVVLQRKLGLQMVKS